MFTINVEIRKERKKFSATCLLIRPKMRKRDKRIHKKIYLVIALMGYRKSDDLCRDTPYVKPIFEGLDIYSFKEKLN